MLMKPLTKASSGRRRLIEIRCKGTSYPLDPQGRHVIPMPRSRRRDVKAPWLDVNRRRPPSPLSDRAAELQYSSPPPVPLFPSFAPEPAAIRAIEAAAPEFPCGELDIGLAAALGNISLQTVTHTDVFDT
jgi:hypothetical protein